MAVQPRTKQILWTRSGGRCAFPGCRKKLYRDAGDHDPDVLLGEIAHIVGQSCDGPRGDKTVPGDEIDGYENLIVLCAEHHTIIDRQVNDYTVDRLVQMRRDHERTIDQQLSIEDRFRSAFEPGEYADEKLSSSLLPVERMPRLVFSAPCTASEKAVKAELAQLRGGGFMTPFIIREKRLWTFCDLESQHSPFADVVDQSDVLAADAFQDWWSDPDRYRQYVDLLNRSLHKVTGRRSLRLDTRHHRYYFEPYEDGTKKTIDYRTLRGRSSTLSVAWEPMKKSTGEGKGYWEHLAVALRFEWFGDLSWCLSIRPERRFTKDGWIETNPKTTGKKATSRKSRMYNPDYRKELQFWRDYLSDGTPRILFDFGGQSIVVPTDFIEPTINWPGVAGDDPIFDQVEYDDDLFTHSAYHQLIDHRSGL